MPGFSATDVADDDLLPLTCTRDGTCCHGKQVWITPWELAGLAAGRGMLPAEFLAAATCDGGIRLAFSGPPGWRGLPACSQYDPATRGCRAHAQRPLACRLYPLGRRRRGDRHGFIHEGAAFPCLAGCPEAADLPRLRVADYLAGQGVVPGLAAQDACLELAQDLAEVAFAIVVDTGLIRMQRPAIAAAWRAAAGRPPATRLDALPPGWRERLLVPGLAAAADGVAWTRAHAGLLMDAAQAEFAALAAPAELIRASAGCLAMGLHLFQASGGDPAQAAERWLGTLRGLR